VIGSRTPRYSRGQRYCERCELAFYTLIPTCPMCGAKMRAEPKKGKSAKYIDPEKNMASRLRYGAGGLGDMAREVFTAKLEFDGDEFHLDKLTREHVERVLGEGVGGGGASIRVVNEFLEGL